MKIAYLSERVTFEKCVAEMDDAGNHINTWTAVFSCAADIGSEGGSETKDAAHTEDRSEVTVTVRWCSEIADVGPTAFRVIFKDDIYDIISVDHANYRKKILKLRCRKAER